MSDSACRSDDHDPCRNLACRPKHVQVHGEPDRASRRRVLLREQGTSWWLAACRAFVRASWRCARARDRERGDGREGAECLVVGTDSGNRNGHPNATADWRCRRSSSLLTTQARGADPTLRFARSFKTLLDREVNRSIAGHGGKISIVDVQDGNLFIAMSGGCQGCAASQVTLRQGFEVMVRGVAPEIVDIVDTTDHVSGKNPFYERVG